MDRALLLASLSQPRVEKSGESRVSQHPAIGLSGRNNFLVTNDDGDFPTFACPNPCLGDRHQRAGSIHSDGLVSTLGNDPVRHSTTPYTRETTRDFRLPLC